MKATFAFLQQTINKILNEIDDSTSTTKKYFEQKPLRLRRQSRTRREKRKKKKEPIHDSLLLSSLSLTNKRSKTRWRENYESRFFMNVCELAVLR
jgi:hypothetical protein